MDNVKLDKANELSDAIAKCKKLLVRIKKAYDEVDQFPDENRITTRYRKIECEPEISKTVLILLEKKVEIELEG